MSKQYLLHSKLSNKQIAEAQRLQRLTLTPELLQTAIEKWDGRFLTVMGGNGTLPLVNINADMATKK